MKHAILLIAYHNFDYVIEEIEKYDEDFSVFIHWDKRNPLLPQQREELSNYRNVKYVGEEFAVNWGSYGIVRATYLLCKKALLFSEIEYFHLISDADALVVDLKTFKNFYIKNIGRNFMSSSILSLEDKSGDKIKYYHRMEKYNIRVNATDKKAYNEELNKQKKEGVRKDLPECPLYSGSAWWSLTKDCVKYLIDNEEFVEKYYTETLFPDEMFTQTVIMNSEFAKTVNYNNKRYISWELRNGNNPAVLDRSDLTTILKSNHHFARKIDPQVSKDLLDAIDTIIFQDYKPINTYTINIIQIIKKCIENLNISYKGIMYGNAGALIFLSHCVLLKVSENVISPKSLKELFRLVIEEFRTVEDSTYTTGQLGLATTLEYMRYFYQTTNYDEDIECILKEINNNVINNVYNNRDSLSIQERMYYNAYFKSLEKGNNLDKLSLYAWEYLCKLPLKIESLPFLNSENNKGLKGLAGIGLYKLTEEYDLSLKDWDFLYLG